MIWLATPLAVLRIDRWHAACLRQAGGFRQHGGAIEGVEP
jgi:hypothetical protein